MTKMKIKRIVSLWRLAGFCAVCAMLGIGIMLSGQDRQKEVNAASGLSGKTVLVDGDSIAEGHGAYSTSRFPGWSYANYLEESYGMSKTNVAFSGARFYWPDAGADCGDGTNNCHIIPKHLTSTIKNTRYDYIILEGAINDLYHSYYGGDTTSYATELRRYFDTITSNEMWKDAKIGFVIVPHPHPSVLESNSATSAFWRTVQSICDEYSIDYINFYKLEANDTFVVPSGFNWNIMNTIATSADGLGGFDGLHPTKGTHAVLGEYIANWMVNLPNYKYTVTFNNNGASMSNIASQTVVHGKAVSQPTYTISSNQHFSHWSTTRNGNAYNFSSGVNENLMLYAVWNANVVFNMNGGTLNGQTAKTVSVNGGSTVSNPGSPVKNGYVFKYWATDVTCGTQYNFVSSVAGDMTLYACYSPEYKLTIDANGGVSTVTTLACEAANGNYCMIQIPSDAPTRARYHFSGYGDDKNSGVVKYRIGDSIRMDSNKTIYAVWYANVVFNMNGGILNEQATMTVSINDGGSVSNPGSPVKNGYVFKYWATDVTCGTQYNFVSSVAGDMTLYACYSPEYKLTIDANGGIGAVALTCEVASGDYCTIAIPSGGVSREEHYLIGYGESASSQRPDYEAGDAVEMRGNKTIYAIWADGRVEQRESDKEYTIGGGVDMMIKINYPLVHFVGLKVDNEVVDNKDGDKYKLEDGSTIITVFGSYLDTLGLGEHTIQAEFDNGALRGVAFAVREKPADDPEVDPAVEPTNGGGDVTPAPNTGRNTIREDSAGGVWLYILPSVVAGAGVLAYRRITSKKHHQKFD